MEFLGLVVVNMSLEVLHLGETSLTVLPVALVQVFQFNVALISIQVVLKKIEIVVNTYLENQFALYLLCKLYQSSGYKFYNRNLFGSFKQQKARAVEATSEIDLTHSSRCLAS